MTNLPAPIQHVTVTLAQQQYRALIDDLQGIIVEGIHHARWAFIKVYHDTGTRILQDYPELNTAESYGKGITKRIALDLGKSQRMIQRSVQIARTWPDLSMLPEGKNVSLHKLIHKYLPGPKGESDRPTTYFDGMAEAVQTGRGWQINLPIDTELDLGGNTPIVHVIVREGP